MLLLLLLLLATVDCGAIRRREGAFGLIEERVLGRAAVFRTPKARVHEENIMVMVVVL